MRTGSQNSETGRSREVHRAFTGIMAMVTCYLLMQIPRPTLITAAFGLDFLIATWRSLWTSS